MSFLNSFTDLFLCAILPQKKYVQFILRKDELRDYKRSCEQYLTQIYELNTKFYRSQAATEQLQTEVEELNHERNTLWRQINEQANCIQLLERKLKGSISVNCALETVKQQWLDIHIEQLNDNAYGAGQVYELYASRKNEAVDRFLWQHSHSLTSDDVDTIKQKTEYLENPGPHRVWDEESGDFVE